MYRTVKIPFTLYMSSPDPLSVPLFHIVPSFNVVSFILIGNCLEDGGEQLWLLDRTIKQRSGVSSSDFTGEWKVKKSIAFTDALKMGIVGMWREDELGNVAYEDRKKLIWEFSDYNDKLFDELTIPGRGLHFCELIRNDAGDAVTFVEQMQERWKTDKARKDRVFLVNGIYGDALCTVWAEVDGHSPRQVGVKWAVAAKGNEFYLLKLRYENNVCNVCYIIGNGTLEQIYVSDDESVFSGYRLYVICCCDLAMGNMPIVCNHRSQDNRCVTSVLNEYRDFVKDVMEKSVVKTDASFIDYIRECLRHPVKYLTDIEIDLQTAISAVSGVRTGKSDAIERATKNWSCFKTYAYKLSRLMESYVDRSNRDKVNAIGSLLSYMPCSHPYIVDCTIDLVMNMFKDIEDDTSRDDIGRYLVVMLGSDLKNACITSSLSKANIEYWASSGAHNVFSRESEDRCINHWECIQVYDRFQRDHRATYDSMFSGIAGYGKGIENQGRFQLTDDFVDWMGMYIVKSPIQFGASLEGE